MNTIEGRWLDIRCYKHNGTIHRFWDRGLVLENNDDYLIVATKRAKVVENNGRCWFTKEPAVTIFSKKEWWNTICMIKKDGICYYCNIASPSIIDGETIKYIDYDLDAKLFPDKVIKVLDEREYKRHRKQYGYNDELNKILRYQTNEIVSKMKAGEFPFIDAKVNEYYYLFLEKITKKV
jgi:hypothetical protein